MLSFSELSSSLTAAHDKAEKFTHNRNVNDTVLVPFVSSVSSNCFEVTRLSHVLSYEEQCGSIITHCLDVSGRDLMAASDKDFGTLQADFEGANVDRSIEDSSLSDEDIIDGQNIEEFDSSSVNISGNSCDGVHIDEDAAACKLNVEDRNQYRRNSK